MLTSEPEISTADSGGRDPDCELSQDADASPDLLQPNVRNGNDEIRRHAALDGVAVRRKPGHGDVNVDVDRLQL